MVCGFPAGARAGNPSRQRELPKANEPGRQPGVGPGAKLECWPHRGLTPPAREPATRNEQRGLTPPARGFRLWIGAEDLTFAPGALTFGIGVRLPPCFDALPR